MPKNVKIHERVHRFWHYNCNFVVDLNYPIIIIIMNDPSNNYEAPLGGCVLVVSIVTIIIMSLSGASIDIILIVAFIFLLVIIPIIIVERLPDKRNSTGSINQSIPDNHQVSIDEENEYSILYDALTKVEDHRSQSEGISLIDEDIMLSREEYQKGRTAIKKLMELIERMSKDSCLREAVIDNGRGINADEGEYNKSSFFLSLKLLLAKDIIYCYENLGLKTEFILDTPENQLLIPITVALVEDKENDSYNDLRRELLLNEPLWKEIRETHEETYKVFRDETETKVTAEGIDDFQLVLLVKALDPEDKYLIELRQGLLEMAETIAGIAGMNKRMEMTLEDFRLRGIKDKEELESKTKKPIDKPEISKSESPSSSIDALDSLIGLKQVKKEVLAMKNFIEINRRREEAGLKNPPISYHCVFTGNPGTGKTTVARIVAGIYKELGILKKAHLVETDRSGLIAEYVGQTAVKTNKIIDSALDGVLFIDEAYSLIGAGKEDFGKEAIATLVKRMEDNRDRLVVILAGYEDEMQKFIESNPGLHSRFNRYIHFEDYSADELKQIFLRMLREYDFMLEEEAEQVLSVHLESCITNKKKDFGNARYVRNLFEGSIKAQAVRLAASPDSCKSQLTTITVEDINAAITDVH